MVEDELDRRIPPGPLGRVLGQRGAGTEGRFDAGRGGATGGIALEYRLIESADSTARSSPTLVLLHEGLGSVAMWKDFPDALAVRTGHAVLVYSRLGYGNSPELTKPRDTDFMHHEATAVLPELLRNLNVREPVLIGHSDGASIAIIHAGSGHAVSGLVLMAPHLFVEEITLNSIADIRREFGTSYLPEKMARYHAHPESMFLGWTDIWLRADFRDWNIERFVDRIRAPMLLIQSDADPFGTLAHVDAIEKMAASPVRKLVLRGSGHSPHVDRRDETIESIADFLGDIV